MTDWVFWGHIHPPRGVLIEWRHLGRGDISLWQGRGHHLLILLQRSGSMEATDMNMQWGDKINITDKDSQEIVKAIRSTQDRWYFYALNGGPYPVPEDTWRDRLTLAWRVLRGQITWRDIQ